MGGVVAGIVGEVVGVAVGGGVRGVVDVADGVIGVAVGVIGVAVGVVCVGAGVTSGLGVGGTIGAGVTIVAMLGEDDGSVVEPQAPTNAAAAARAQSRDFTVRTTMARAGSEHRTQSITMRRQRSRTVADVTRSQPGS